MAFWSIANAPIRQFRFLISNTSDEAESVWYWAKSVSKPSFEISSTEHQLLNHKFKYPGILSWNDITMTLVDTGGKTKQLMDQLITNGYNYPDKFETTEGISKTSTTDYLDELTIQQLDGEGVAIETWRLKGAFIKSTNFGDLDYGSDELVTLQLTISYDWAELNTEVQTEQQ
jgi:hypothetical protein